MWFAPALAAWLLLLPPPADRLDRINHNGSTRPPHQRSITRAVPHARRSANAHLDWTAALRLLTRGHRLSRRRPRGGWMPPTSVTQRRRSDASATAASDAGLADAAADGSWGAVYWRLSGGAAVIASLIVQVTVRARPSASARRHCRASAPRRLGRGCCWRCPPPVAAAPSALAAPPTVPAATAAAGPAVALTCSTKGSPAHSLPSSAC